MDIYFSCVCIAYTHCLCVVLSVVDLGFHSLWKTGFTLQPLFHSFRLNHFSQKIYVVYVTRFPCCCGTQKLGKCFGSEIADKLVGQNEKCLQQQNRGVPSHGNSPACGLYPSGAVPFKVHVVAVLWQLCTHKKDGCLQVTSTLFQTFLLFSSDVL